MYPVSRLLANPKVFHAIANYLDEIVTADILRDTFLSLLEMSFEELDDEDCEFEAEEVRFDSNLEEKSCSIHLDTGLIVTIQVSEEEREARISSKEDFVTASGIYKNIVSAIEEANPDLEGDVALCSPPTPSNSYLLDPKGNKFIGDFHLLSDPDKKFRFIAKPVESDDPDQPDSKLVATIKPI